MAQNRAKIGQNRARPGHVESKSGQNQVPMSQILEAGTNRREKGQSQLFSGVAEKIDGWGVAEILKSANLTCCGC